MSSRDMSKSFLILHGIANHRPPEHWQFWLAARLAEQGHQVLYPSLPDTDAPTYAGWSACLREQLARLDRGAERVVVCHSLACLLWFRAATSVTEDERVDRLLLVSPPADAEVPEEGADLRIGAFDPAPVRASVRGEIRIACSDGDPYNPRGAQDTYAMPLDIRADVFPGAGHITPSSGFGPWPFAEAWCAGDTDSAWAVSAPA
jgi:predicted alpha/beta hydrolase family esterase